MKTGFEKLDNIINTLNAGELTCIASRPGIGKTTLSIDIVNNISKQTNNQILFISLENSKEQLEKRIESDKVEIITDKISITDIEDTCRDLSNTYNCLSLIVIDYLQLIEPKVSIKDKSREKVDTIKALKQLAVELNVPIIITSQLPRTDDKPKLEDLNVNGTTYYYHKVLLLSKDTENKVKIDIAKNKGISHSFVDLEFDRDNFSFKE
mgnify:CR=1 FL=1